ncbi:MAG TPA: hypothetical protein PKL98_00315 [Candidatus Pacearchaeota archaeon]|nr:hypothetical protein [Candidatus Pacearchaeota archaeon]HPM08362.1 hypothetical protein [Candidatus Pacearchaeota archaeon]
METKLLKFGENRGILVEKGTKDIVLMIGGFERCATTEKKFKILSDMLDFSSFRFDYDGIGLSDGDFSKSTVMNLSNQFKNIILGLRQNGYSEFSIIAHSLGACVYAMLKDEISFKKTILLSPALNQKDLMRYWFTISNFKNSSDSTGIKIDWDNYKRYLDEDNFKKDCFRNNRMTKQNYIASNYYLENSEIDYSKYINSADNILHIHGEEDEKVPIKSLNVRFPNFIFVKKGDHDLERPDMITQWLDQAIDFINR